MVDGRSDVLKWNGGASQGLTGLLEKHERPFASGELFVPQELFDHEFSGDCRI